MLDGLSETMSSMVQQQDQLETEIAEFRYKLQSHLETLDELCSTYESYQLSFNVLVLELERRRQWSEEVQAEVIRMRGILAEYRTTEVQRRESFMATYGSSLPEDLCHFIGNEPTFFDIIPVSSEEAASDQVPALESFPHIPADILAEAQVRVDEARMQET